MSRFMTITLERRGVSCVAQLLDKDAPRTCEAVWASLPHAGPVHHAKYARNEIYTMVERFIDEPIGLENPTVTPLPGDVVFFDFHGGMLDRAFKEEKGLEKLPGVIDLAIFYGRNNLLVNADLGWIPGTVFATVVENLDEMAAACNDVWRAGAIGERLTFRRAAER